MKLYKATITGASNSTPTSMMQAFTERYPFLEWGILLSEKSITYGSLRFPSLEWLDKLYRLPDRKRMSLSGHICGKWVRDICQGRWTILDELPCASMFERFQLNFHAIIHTIDTYDFTEGLKDPRLTGKQIIFQMDGVNDLILGLAGDIISVAPLFDQSGGAGLLPDKWALCDRDFCGYAGGLSPDNITRQLEIIAQVAGSKSNVWVDTETRVRTDDDRSLCSTKMSKFLDKVEFFIKY